MLNAIKSRQKDLPAMVGIGVGLALIGIGPRWFFATELAITEPYGTDVLGRMILGMIPLVTAGYLFTDTLLYNRYIERSQRAAKKGWLILAFCLFYGLTLGWLWFFVYPGELLIFDRAVVIVLVAALFLDWYASLVIGLFAVVVRGALIILLEADRELLLGALADLAQAPAFLLDYRWVWYEPGVLALLTALLFGMGTRAYHHQPQRQQHQIYPIWIGFPCAMLIEVVYLASVYWGWERGAFIDLTVNYAIPDILGIGAPTLLLLLLMDAAMAEAERKRAQEAELALEKTKLLYLQSQINPHFLFNALTTIQGLTYDQPAKARDLLVHLGDMYEMIARYRNHLIALEQELEHVRSYLVIATARWPARLHAVAVCYEAEDGLQALRLLDQYACDLVFLDVNMPGPSGITIGAEMSARRPAPLLIFVTGYVHYAADAFEVNAVDYVRKGAGELRVYRALGKALDRLRLENRAMPVTDVRLWAKSQDGDTQLLNAAEILWAEAKDKKVFVHTRQGEGIEVNYTLEELMAQLPSNRFVQVHRAYLVNIAHIKKRVDYSATSAHLLLDDESIIPISRTYLPALKTRFSP